MNRKRLVITNDKKKESYFKKTNEYKNREK